MANGEKRDVKPSVLKGLISGIKSALSERMDVPPTWIAAVPGKRDAIASAFFSAPLSVGAISRCPGTNRLRFMVKL